MTQWFCVVQSLVEIGPVVLKKKTRMWNLYNNDAKLTWAFDSGAWAKLSNQSTMGHIALSKKVPSNKKACPTLSLNQYIDKKQFSDFECTSNYFVAFKYLADVVICPPNVLYRVLPVCRDTCTDHKTMKHINVFIGVRKLNCFKCIAIYMYLFSTICRLSAYVL